MKSRPESKLLSKKPITTTSNAQGNKRKHPRSPKLGDTAEQPSKPKFDAPFHWRRRMPCWRPDADADLDANGESTQPLFIDEALLKTAEGFKRFPVGHEIYNPGHPDYFQEPTDNEGWKKYNQWILGTQAPKKDPRDTQPTFADLILEFLPLIKRYNRALYTLRRLHLPNYGSTTQNYGPLPGDDDGTNPAQIPEDKSKFKQLLGAVKQEWEDTTDELDMLIRNVGKSGDKVFGVVAVDMIEVNGYIVSMRLIGDTMTKINARAGDVVIKEVGGSSSHVSITSPFGR